MVLASMVGCEVASRKMLAVIGEAPAELAGVVDFGAPMVYCGLCGWLVTWIRFE